MGVKFATALVMIGYFVLLGLKKTKYFIGVAISLMVIGVIIATVRTNFQPWYLLYVFPYAVLIIEKRSIKYPFYIFSISSVLYYVPYLYGGSWNPPIPLLLNNFMIGTLLVSIVAAIVFFRFSKKETN